MKLPSLTIVTGVLSALLILDSAQAKNSLLRRKVSGERSSAQPGRKEMHVESLIDSLDEEADWFGRFLQDVSISFSMSLPNKNAAAPNQPTK
jgi:hypothetical protein